MAIARDIKTTLGELQVKSFCVYGFRRRRITEFCQTENLVKFLNRYSKAMSKGARDTLKCQVIIHLQKSRIIAIIYLYIPFGLSTMRNRANGIRKKSAPTSEMDRKENQRAYASSLKSQYLMHVSFLLNALEQQKFRTYKR